MQQEASCNNVMACHIVSCPPASTAANTGTLWRSLHAMAMVFLTESRKACSGVLVSGDPDIRWAVAISDEASFDTYIYWYDWGWSELREEQLGSMGKPCLWPDVQKLDGHHGRQPLCRYFMVRTCISTGGSFWGGGGGGFYKISDLSCTRRRWMARAASASVWTYEISNSTLDGSPSEDPSGSAQASRHVRSAAVVLMSRAVVAVGLTITSIALHTETFRMLRMPCCLPCGTRTRSLCVLLYWTLSRRPRHHDRFLLIGLCWLWGCCEFPPPPAFNSTGEMLEAGAHGSNDTVSRTYGWREQVTCNTV